MLGKLMNIGAGRTKKALVSVAKDAEKKFESLRGISDEELAETAAELAERAKRGEEASYLAVEAFAVAALAVERETGLVLRPNQFIAAAALAFGRVAELATGEGKTLAAIPAVFLLALEGKGVHVVTANEYLAARDAEQAGRILGRCGMRVGLSVSSQKDPEMKREAYSCDVTYVTASELGFDFLRDRLTYRLERQVGRELHAVVVDELDSILIDEARTPLVISGRGDAHLEIVATCHKVVAGMKPLEHFEVDLKNQNVALTAEGTVWVGEALGRDLSDPVNVVWAAAVRQALMAREVYRRDRDYVIRDGEVLIVDQSTGRAMPGRRWNGGLHQAIEQKERVEVRAENRTVASTTLQSLFKSYTHLSGMTGTAKSSEEELTETYGLEVIEVPSHKPVVRVDEPDVVHGDQKSKLRAVCERVVAESGRGRPVLIGTGSVAESEKLSQMLQMNGVSHQVLNAKQHDREAEIIAQAGRIGAVTVSTSMAGRGVDILLGGDPVKLAAADQSNLAEWVETCREDGEKVRALGGLLVIGTTRAAARRVDDQLRGRAGRQGDPGASAFHLSLDDELLAPYLDSSLGWLLRRTEGVAHKSITKAIESAQSTIEGDHTRQRVNLARYDEVYAAQRETVWALRQQLLEADDDGMIEFFAATLNSLEESGVPEDVLARCGVERFEDLVSRSEARYAELGTDAPKVARHIWLKRIDAEWVDHLERLEVLRDAITLRSSAKLDPLSEWKREAFELFEEFVFAVAVGRIEWWVLADLDIDDGTVTAVRLPGERPVAR
jgi:preprotein translocase subunit SecA